MLKTNMSGKIVLDIETIGSDFDSFDEMSKEYLLKFASTEEEIQEAKESLGFSPLTGQVAAIGMLNPETNRGAVYYQAPEGLSDPVEEDGIQFVPDTEEGILNKFWDAVKHYDQVITFNGRGFDAPYLMIRSAVNKIKPTRDLMPNRYTSSSHVDLLDQLTFYGAVRKKFSLHMWCKAFGIKSPKEDGVTGHEVNDLFNEQKYLDIARYCLGDLYATAELFEYWDKYVRVPKGR